jgi:hypothetical protein
MRTKILCLAVMGLASCGGSGAGLDENGRPLTGEPTPLVPELQSIQKNIFTPICAACHAGSSAPLGFRLDEGFSYSMLVNTVSVEVPALLRVSPGNPDQSYLVQKLEGHAAVGGQMPLGQSPLPQATIDVIREWIANGAAAPSEVLLRVDKATDISKRLASASLRRSGGDSTFDDGNDITLDAMTVEVRSTNPTVIALSLPPDSWVPDTYELTVGGDVLPFTIEAAQ